MSGEDKIKLESETTLPKLGDLDWIQSMELDQSMLEEEVGPTVGPEDSESDSSDPLPPTTGAQSCRDGLKRKSVEQGTGGRRLGIERMPGPMSDRTT